MLVGVQSRADVPYQSEAEAWSACYEWSQVKNINGDIMPGASCVWNGYPSGKNPTVSSNCSTLYYTGGYTGEGWRGEIKTTWCIAADCVAGTRVGSAAVREGYAYDQKTDDRGCCASFVKKSSDSYGSNKWWSGDVVDTGGYCNENYAATNGTGGDPGNVKHDSPPPKMCNAGGVSCYDPKSKTACYGTESGEQVCVAVGAPDPGPGGCKSGATGSLCSGAPDGSPSSPPPDPPIPPDTSPNMQDRYVRTDGSGTPQVTINVSGYSGTSPGSAPSADSGTAGGQAGQSNSTASGNSGPNGTSPAQPSSAGGAGDPGGKCPDGSVPTASGCSGTYRDNGCDSPPACFGDAVLCGIAVNTKMTQCAVKAAAAASTGGAGDALKGYPDGDPMDASGDPKASSLASEVDLGAQASSLDAGGFGYSTSCPLVDQSFVVMGHSITIPLADKCEPLSWIRYIMIALGFFVGAKIIAGVK